MSTLLLWIPQLSPRANSLRGYAESFSGRCPCGTRSWAPYNTIVISHWFRVALGILTLWHFLASPKKAKQICSTRSEAVCGAKKGALVAGLEGLEGSLSI